MDECAEAIHSCQADVEQCRNIEGAYECDMKCGKGFTYSIGLGVCVGEFSFSMIFNKSLLYHVCNNVVVAFVDKVNVY